MFKHFPPIRKTGSRLLLLVLLQVPFLGFIPQAVAAPPAGTKIENQATGSFLDPIDNGVKNIESNTVQVTMSEIAGITATAADCPKKPRAVSLVLVVFRVMAALIQEMWSISIFW
jgi:hypothetical protein